MLFGRIDGTNLYGPPEHPATIYELLGRYGLLWKVIVTHKTLNTVGLMLLVRLAFSLFMFCVGAVVVLLVLQRSDAFSPR